MEPISLGHVSPYAELESTEVVALVTQRSRMMGLQLSDFEIEIDRDNGQVWALPKE